MRIAFSHLTAGATTLAGIALVVAGSSVAGGDDLRTIGLAVFALGLWASGVVPGYVASLWFFLFAMLLRVAPPATVFSGFAATSFWLVFGGLIIGQAVKETGLGARIARSVASRVGSSYRRAVVAVVIVGIAMAFLMPSSMGRIVLLMPIVMALADSLGFATGSRGRTGLAIAMVFGTLMPAFAVLPANVPNLILAGAAETLYGVTPTYGFYLLLHFPVLGALKAVVVVVLVLWMFDDRPAPVGVESRSEPMSPAERRLAVVLALSLLFWMTDFLHHVSPAWVSLAAAAVCLLPRIGMLRAEAVQDRIGVGVLVYIAGILGLGATIAAGLGDRLGPPLIELAGFAPDAGWRNFAAMTGLTALLGLLTTQPGLPAVLTPLSGSIAEAMQVPVMSVLMMQVVGFSTVILPYQVPPFVVGLQLGGVSAATTTRYCLALLAVTVVVLLPLDFLWWRVLGYAP